MASKKEAIKAIKEIDESIGLLRESWLDADTVKKPKYFRMINTLLDDRLIQMRIRDTVKKNG